MQMARVFVFARHQDRLPQCTRPWAPNPRLTSNLNPSRQRRLAGCFASWHSTTISIRSSPKVSYSCYSERFLQYQHPTTHCVEGWVLMISYCTQPKLKSVLRGEPDVTEDLSGRIQEKSHEM
jgi:hypothetical protein